LFFLSPEPSSTISSSQPSSSWAKTDAMLSPIVWAAFHAGMMIEMQDANFSRTAMRSGRIRGSA